MLKTRSRPEFRFSSVWGSVNFWSFSSVRFRYFLLTKSDFFGIKSTVIGDFKLSDIDTRYRNLIKQEMVFTVLSRKQGFEFTFLFTIYSYYICNFQNSRN